MRSSGSVGPNSVTQGVPTAAARCINPLSGAISASSSPMIAAACLMLRAPDRSRAAAGHPSSGASSRMTTPQSASSSRAAVRRDCAGGYVRSLDVALT